MEREDVIAWIEGNLDSIVTTLDGDDVYWFYDPDGRTDPARRMPFATLMTSDKNDSASNLSRPGVYRLNIGIYRGTYTTLFGAPPKADWSKPFLDTGHDYTELDKFMPHPVYCSMAWISILNPSMNSFGLAEAFLSEAHDQAKERLEGKEEKSN